MITERTVADYPGPGVRDGGSLFLLPHPLLRPYIANYTLTLSGGMPAEQAIVPTASSTLVYTVEDERLWGGLRGVNTKVVNIGGYAAQFPLLLLVEFHTGGLYPFLGIDQTELADRSVALWEVDGGMDGEIRECLCRADGIPALCRGLDGTFLPRLNTGLASPAVSLCMERIFSTWGTAGGAELARAASYSERQLNRLFRRQVGTGVKVLSRIVRANRALSMLSRPAVRLWQVAECAGYHDVPHLVRDLQDICAVTPRHYRDNALLFYSDPHKLSGYRE